MQTGWLNSDGNWYYLYGDGTMAHDTTVDGSHLNSAGAWTTGIPVTPTTTSYNNGNSGSSNNSGDVQYVDSNGNGLIKGSKTHICHTPGSTYYNIIRLQMLPNGLRQLKKQRQLGIEHLEDRKINKTEIVFLGNQKYYLCF